MQEMLNFRSFHPEKTRGFASSRPSCELKHHAEDAESDRDHAGVSGPESVYNDTPR